MSNLELTCHECGRVTVLDAEAQQKLLRELARPAKLKIIDCPCGAYQWGLETSRGACSKNPISAESASE